LRPRIRVILLIELALSAAMLISVGGSTAAVGMSSIDSIRAQEWWLSSMHASDTMWPISRGNGMTVAVIDSGVEASHPDLVGKILPGDNFSRLPGGARADVVGHGTAMASLIAGTGRGLGGQGIYGLAPDAKILPLRIISQGDSPSSSAEFIDEESEAIRFAADSGAQIINMSLGGPGASLKLHGAIDYALAKGKLIVAAVGNSGTLGNPVDYPAGFPGVVGVGETDVNGNVASESEHGSQVVLTAPGADIYEACVGPSGYCSSHGTSDSTALVSASAALLWAVHPSWTANQVIRVLINTANSGGKSGVQDPYYGYGVVRPRLALTDPGDPGPADVSPLSGATASRAGAPAVSAAAVKSSGSSMGWVVGGAVGAFVLVGLVLVRRRARG
jgi:type VII secretion-associated serine protease mycosin